MQFIAYDAAISTRKPRLLRALAMTHHASDFEPALKIRRLVSRASLDTIMAQRRAPPLRSRR